MIIAILTNIALAIGWFWLGYMLGYKRADVFYTRYIECYRNLCSKQREYIELLKERIPKGGEDDESKN